MNHVFSEVRNIYEVMEWGASYVWFYIGKLHKWLKDVQASLKLFLITLLYIT